VASELIFKFDKAVWVLTFLEGLSRSDPVRACRSTKFFNFHKLVPTPLAPRLQQSLALTEIHAFSTVNSEPTASFTYQR
jgi:hypothetical protein